MNRSVLEGTYGGGLQTPEAGVLEHRGCRLAYKLVGKGPPVLFIQGSGVHGSGWGPQILSLIHISEPTRPY